MSKGLLGDWKATCSPLSPPSASPCGVCQAAHVCVAHVECRDHADVSRMAVPVLTNLSGREARPTSLCPPLKTDQLSEMWFYVSPAGPCVGQAPGLLTALLCPQHSAQCGVPSRPSVSHSCCRLSLMGLRTLPAPQDPSMCSLLQRLLERMK